MDNKPEKTLSAKIVILNYNGRELLPECLPSVVEAARRSRWPVQVVILDNLSTDNGLGYVQKTFPKVEIVYAPANLFLCSYNDYLQKMHEPIAILLNNDIRVEMDFVDPLIQKFAEDPMTFLVAPRVMKFDGTRIEAAKTMGKLRFGIFWASARYPGYEKEALIPSETFSSGFGAFSREFFCQLGGYDPLFLPGIFEDVDLCFRAQRSGYHLYYEPESVVYHKGQASFKKKFGSYRMARMAHRNNFLFMWKNFKGIAFWAMHCFFLPLRLLYALGTANFAFLQGFWDAAVLRLSTVNGKRAAA